MNNIKIIANYLPQYHVIPENSAWWGEGFTDWVAVKNSKPLYDGHSQPRIPLNNHYYSLDNVEEIRWQTEIAKKYGVYGFGIYHYWFSSNMMLLQKPAEIIRDNTDIDIHYLFIWDNSSWCRTWSKGKFSHSWAPKFDNNKSIGSNENGILAEIRYGTKKDWKEHFLYLLSFFKDERYIKIKNKPVFIFFKPHNNFVVIRQMTEYWNELAKQYGFAGIMAITLDSWNKKHNLEYKVRYAPFSSTNLKDALLSRLRVAFNKKIYGFNYCDYDYYWQRIIKNAKHADNNTFLSGFVDYDDTPRRGENARIMNGVSVEKFEKYIYQLLKISKNSNKEYVFITAWNEWGEGAYLEPDEKNGFAYLEALKKAIDRVNN